MSLPAVGCRLRVGARAETFRQIRHRIRGGRIRADDDEAQMKDDRSTGARPYITCRELIDFLYLYLEGELAPDRASEFERHLGVCDSCVNYIETYKKAIVLGKHSFQDSEAPASACAPEDLVRAVLATRKKSKL